MPKSRGIRSIGAPFGDLTNVAPGRISSTRRLRKQDSSSTFSRATLLPLGTGSGAGIPVGVDPGATITGGAVGSGEPGQPGSGVAGSGVGNDVGPAVAIDVGFGVANDVGFAVTGQVGGGPITLPDGTASGGHGRRPLGPGGS